MKNNTKKGFTLVELLVVIAILAILATVSVVGYTSFIESANVAVDEDLASQLNHFLAAYQVKNNEKITPHNIRKITAEILELGGLDKLEPVSDGRNFYYDFANNQYVVMEDEKASNSNAAGMHFLVHAAGEPTSQFLGSSFTEGGKYFLVSTGGNKLADVINGFYSIDNNQLIDLTVLNQLVADAEALRDSQPELANFVANSAVVHQDKKYHVAEENKYLIIPDNANQIGGTSIVLNGDGEAKQLPLVSGQTEAIEIPDQIGHVASSNLTANVTIKMDKTAEEIAGMIFESNMTELPETSVTVTVESSEGIVKIEVKIEIADGVNVQTNVVVDANGQKVEDGYFENGIADFDVEIEDNDNDYIYNNVVAEGNNNAYISWYKFSTGEEFNLLATKLIGGSSEFHNAVSDYKIEWSVHEDSKDYITLVNKDGTFKFTGVIPPIAEDGSCVVKVNAKDIFGGYSETFEIRIVRVKSATFAYDGKEFASTNTLLFGEGSKDSYTITATTSRTYSAITEITLDNTVSITPVVIEGQDNVFAPEGNLLKLNGEADGTQSIKITVDGYTSEPISITVYNAASLTAVKNNANIVLVGDDNPITVGDLLKINADKTMPANAEVWVLKELGDSNFGNMNAYFESEYVADGKIPVNTADWTTTQIKFTGNGGKAIVTIVAPDGEGNYIRIADNHEVTIVDGKNVRKIADLEDGVNNVLLTNLVADETYAGFTLTGKTLYGNQHYIDLRGYNDAGVPFEKDGKTSFEFVDLKKTVPYAKTLEALITLKGATLDNVKIVGEVYKSTDFIYQNPNDFGYGASLVKAEGGSTIVGCYLANTRSPLITTGAVTVEDTTIFGGNYANVDVRDGSTLVLKGNVTTVNQIITGVTDNTVGFGIAVDLFADYETTSIVIDNDGDDKCILKQYNYVSQADASKMPIVTYGAYGQDVNIFLSKKLNNIFNDTTGTYDSIIYKDKDGKEYINATIAFENGLLVKMNGSDVTEEQTGTKTGNGQQISGCDYEMKTAVSHREKSVDLGCSTMTVTMDATIFFWTPTADVNTNSGEHFDNTVPEYCLPGYYVPGN